MLIVAFWGFQIQYSNLNSVIKPYLLLERTLQMNKNPTAEELHKLIMRKKITYE